MLGEKEEIGGGGGGGGVLKGRKWEWLFSPNSDVSATPISG